MLKYDNAYDELQSIIDNMNVIFDKLDLPLLECNLAIPGTLLLFIESIVSNGTIEKNIKEINKQLEEIVATYEQRICVDEFEEILSEPSEKAESKSEENSNKLFDENNVISQVESKSVFENIDIKEVVNNPKEDPHISDDASLNMIMDIIGMRDNLILRQGMIELQNPELAQQTSKIIDAILLETSNTLKKNNVTILNSNGLFETVSQKIMGTEKTDDKTLENVIAKTVKMGYKYKEKLIRPQEVVVYSLE